MSEQEYSFLTEEDIDAWPDPIYLVEGVIPEAAFVVISAPPASGKTFLVLSMLYALSYGVPWLEIPVQQCSSIYGFGEGGSGIKKRKFPLKRQQLHGLPVLFLKKLPPLHFPKEVKKFLSAVSKLEPRPKVIVFDTLARAFPGGDENSSQDMGLLVRGIDEIISKTGATVILLHHTDKKGRGPRGSGALIGAMDVLIEVNGSMPDLILTCGKIKDGKPFKDINVVMKSVKLPNGETTLLPQLETDIKKIKSRSAEKNGGRNALEQHVQAIYRIVEASMPEGLRNADILEQFEEQGRGKKPTFDRAMRDINEREIFAREEKGREVIYRISPDQ